MNVSIHDLRAWKSEGRRFTMLTAYDFPTAQILDAAGVPVLLVGDSLGSNVLGYANELPVTMEDMLHHMKAVSRGVDHAMVVGDMPFMSYQASIEDGVRNAGRLIKEGGAHAVKVEGPQMDLTHRLVEIGIPVMAHVGLTPQSVNGLGGYRVQGRGEDAHKVLEQATQLEKAGAFAIVLEAMPAGLGEEITSIPADPHDRHRRRPRHRRTGAGHQRPAGRHGQAAEAREGLCRPAWNDHRSRDRVHRRRPGRDLPRRRSQLLVGEPRGPQTARMTWSFRRVLWPVAGVIVLAIVAGMRASFLGADRISPSLGGRRRGGRARRPRVRTHVPAHRGPTTPVHGRRRGGARREPVPVRPGVGWRQGGLPVGRSRPARRPRRGRAGRVAAVRHLHGVRSPVVGTPRPSSAQPPGGRRRRLGRARRGRPVAVPRAALYRDTGDGRRQPTGAQLVRHHVGVGDPRGAGRGEPAAGRRRRARGAPQGGSRRRPRSRSAVRPRGCCCSSTNGRPTTPRAPCTWRCRRSWGRRS